MNNIELISSELENINIGHYISGENNELIIFLEDNLGLNVQYLLIKNYSETEVLFKGELLVPDGDVIILSECHCEVKKIISVILTLMEEYDCRFGLD